MLVYWAGEERQAKRWMRTKKDKAVNPDLWQKLLDFMRQTRGRYLGERPRRKSRKQTLRRNREAITHLPDLPEDKGYRKEMGRQLTFLFEPPFNFRLGFGDCFRDHAQAAYDRIIVIALPARHNVGVDVVACGPARCRCSCRIEPVGKGFFQHFDRFDNDVMCS